MLAGGSSPNIDCIATGTSIGSLHVSQIFRTSRWARMPVIAEASR